MVLLMKAMERGRSLATPGHRAAPPRERPESLAILAFLAIVVLVSSCGPGSSRTSGQGGSSAASTCVSNVSGVISKVPTKTSTQSSLPAALVAKLDAAVSSSFKKAAASGAIVGVRTPKGTWVHTHGVADPTTGLPITSDMHMRIGSVTKTFTVTLIMQLAQEGKLSLSDGIGKYVDGVPNGDKITLAMLADMTSGIASYYTKPFLERYFGDPSTVFTPAELVAYGVAASPAFRPGAKFDYSNTNTILLGEVVERVTGESFGEVLQQRILTPLGMLSTSFPTTSSAIPSPHAQGYTLQGSRNPQNPANATDWNPSFGWAAGAMISTVQDLLTYDRALGTGQGLLSAASQEQRLRSFPKPAGYGLGMACVDGWVGHTGELPGFNTTVFYNTSTDTSVVVLVNSDIPTGKCESPTLTDNPAELPCASPASRIFEGVSTALGTTAHLPAAK